MAPKPLVKKSAAAGKEVTEGKAAKAQQKDEELVLTLSMQRNNMALTHVRTYSGVTAGAVAGLLHAGGIMGIVIYALVTLAASGFVYLKVGGQVKKYFVKETDPFFSQIFGGLMVYLDNKFMASRRGDPYHRQFYEVPLDPAIALFRRFYCYSSLLPSYLK
ncbi:unnamed protein product [Amoebophrya sp. A25]|nr:unnamed protein product [Amoebophrya sp. A25]|eukprot:GSA25T00017594001.1